MAVYIGICLLLAYFGIMQKRIKEKKICAFICVISLFLISAFRSFRIGDDYKRYVAMFLHGSYIAYGHAYVFINDIASAMGKSYIYLGLMVNLVIFGILYYFYKKELDSRDWVFALAVWTLNPYCFIQGTMNMLRQGCAMACVLLAMGFLCKEKKNYPIAVLIILSAGAFHKSAYLFLLLIPFCIIRWKRIYHVVMLTFCALMNLLLSGGSFMALFARLTGFGGYVDYFPSKFDMPVFTLFVVVIGGYLLYRYPLLYENKKEKWYVDLYLISLSALLLLVKNDQAYRIYVYFSFAAPIAISYMSKNLKEKCSYKEGFLMRAGYILYYLLMFWTFLVLQMVNKNESYYPFVFFWQD